MRLWRYGASWPCSSRTRSTSWLRTAGACVSLTWTSTFSTSSVTGIGAPAGSACFASESRVRRPSFGPPHSGSGKAARVEGPGVPIVNWLDSSSPIFTETLCSPGTMAAGSTAYSESFRVMGNSPLGGIEPRPRQTPMNWGSRVYCFPSRVTRADQ